MAEHHYVEYYTRARERDICASCKQEIKPGDHIARLINTHKVHEACLFRVDV